MGAFQDKVLPPGVRPPALGGLGASFGRNGAEVGERCDYCNRWCDPEVNPGATIIAVKWSSRWNEYVIAGHLGERLRRWRLRNNPLARTT